MSDITKPAIKARKAPFQVLNMNVKAKIPKTITLPLRIVATLSQKGLNRSRGLRYSEEGRFEYGPMYVTLGFILVISILLLLGIDIEDIIQRLLDSANAS